MTRAQTRESARPARRESESGTPLHEGAKPSGRLGVLFFLSGAAGLIYEVVWVRALGWVSGGEALAVSAVLTAYFTGVSLGAHFLGKRMDRAASPLGAYARLELGIAAAGVYSAFALRAANSWLPFLSTGESGPVTVVTTFGVALFAFFPATFLMGGTLPTLVSWSTERLVNAPRSLARLYALNTLGAVAGSLCSGWVLIVQIGA